MGIAKHVECDAVADMFSGAHAIDRFLHLAMTTMAAFHGVGSRRESLHVEACECLVSIGAEQCLEGLARLPEATHPSTKLGQRL